MTEIVTLMKSMICDYVFFVCALDYELTVSIVASGSPSSSPSLEQSRRRTWSGEESIQTSDSTTDDEVERPPPPLPRPEHTLPRPLSPEQGHGYLVIMG